MKKMILVAVVLVWIPCSFAQVNYQQKEFVFSIPQAPAIPAASECDEGIAFITKHDIYDIKPTFAGKWSISTIRTREKNGKVLENDVESIGEILICQDWQTYWPERNLVPVYYEIMIGGRKFRAVGAGTSPNFPQFDVLPGGGQVMTPDGYPESGVVFLNYSATVLPGAPGKVGGSFNIGNLGFLDETPRAYYDHYSIGVLRILDPATYVEPVLVTYEYLGNFFDQLEGDTSVYSTRDRVRARFTIDCARAHKAGDCKNLPYTNYVSRRAIAVDSIEFSAGPALLPTPDGRIDFDHFFLSTDANGRINSWDMDLHSGEPFNGLNVDTDSYLDSAWAIDGGATIVGHPGTWSILQNPK